MLVETWFLAANRLGVHEAISFDQDYWICRFGRDRRQAFTIHA